MTKFPGEIEISVGGREFSPGTMPGIITGYGYVYMGCLASFASFFAAQPW